MSCIDNYSHETLLKGSFKECSDYIKQHYKNIREFNPGDEILEGVMLIGVPPIPVGYEEDFIIFPYTKPCYGTHVLKVPMNQYIDSHEKTKKEGEKKGILSKLKFW
ncbi:Uncharacterised conserved protein UCP006577 [Methanococcus vannielii SB]|jgi:hypothetical protein|uniref:Uncharacterized conserved protein UCP006577 n=1 Tax=Methanococcus vannielii (strain ATCC 35089 / DSM 1224 / JCM 13029 / OCM 148 / SB) TaxID=406327 RepID=A6USJ6_METVS|nr:DUF1894 domain-containing protein [Methanococcus vannielii]ABR55468.1 Uncharacterised conserved protein UCP006577 [Methanococcus vannielii SB]